jgi:hypothetical protein
VYRISTEGEKNFSEDVTLSVYCVHGFLYNTLWPNASKKFSEHGIRIFYVHCAQISLHAEHAALKDRIINNHKQRENMEYFSYLRSQIRNFASCACEIKSRISIAK